MGILSTLRQYFAPAAKAATPPPAMQGGAVAVSARSAARGSTDMLRLYNSNDELRKVVSRVAKGTGAVRWRVKKNGKEQPNHELARLFRAPNPQMSGPAWRELWCLYMDLVGESFDLLLASDRRGYKWDICPVPPPDVQLAEGGAIRVRLGARVLDVPREMYVWSKEHNVLDPYGRGVGAAHALADEIVTAEAAAKWTGAFFRNGARPDLVMSMKGATDAQVTRARADWNNKYQGEQLAHQVAFLGGDWTVHEMQVKVKDLALIEVREQAADAIREMYGVPPELFGQLDSSNKATAVVAEALFAKYVLVPRLELMKREWEAKLLPLLGYTDVELEFDSPIPADIETRLELMRVHPHAFTLNEIRREAGLAARKGGDVYVRVPGLVEVSAGAIEDMTDQARLLDDGPPPVPRRPALRLLKSADVLPALEAALVQLGVEPAQLAASLVRWRAAVDGGAPQLRTAEAELQRAAEAAGITDYTSALAALREAA